MSTHLKVILWLSMIVGFIFGYAGLVIPGQTAILETPRPDTYQFQRLHIFLFNLVSAGAILLYFTEERLKLTWRGWIYLLASFVFSIAAFLNRYMLAALLAVLLAVIVEAIRIKRFAFLPVEFFTRSVPLTRKFHHAAVLCLSLGLLICAGVMIDNQYLHLLNLSYLILDDFFLGFSFPISLATFAVMFSIAPDDPRSLISALREASFWIITIGVIVFFVFIILGILVAEIVIAAVLLLDVLLIYYLFRLDLRDRGEPAELLTSGMMLHISRRKKCTLTE